MLIIISAFSITGCSSKKLVKAYTSADAANIVKDNDLNLLSTGLCVTGQEDILSDEVDADYSAASALFDITNTNTVYARNIYEKLYPASTTKVLTALVALKYGKLDDEITVSENALNLEAGASLCGLSTGDKITLKDALYGLLLASGNDAGVAIAEHISGSIADFSALMNKEAKGLGAISSNFINPHGLHDNNHYTTVYDMYIIFNEAIKNKDFLDIIATKEYVAEVIHSDSSSEKITFSATNYYYLGYSEAPEGVTVLGGKTGTTDEAGSCLVLLTQKGDNKYISIVYKAIDKASLYKQMNQLLSLE